MTSLEEEKILFHHDNAACAKLEQLIDKLNELGFNLFPYLPYCPDQAPNDYRLFVDIKKMHQRKKFDTNEDKDKQFYKHSFEKLGKR